MAGQSLSAERSMIRRLVAISLSRFTLSHETPTHPRGTQGRDGFKAAIKRRIMLTIREWVII